MNNHTIDRDMDTLIEYYNLWQQGEDEDVLLDIMADTHHCVVSHDTTTLPEHKRDLLGEIERELYSERERRGLDSPDNDFSG
mgnify:CR=1 FL=1